MTNTKDNQNILTNPQGSQFASDFFVNVKNINDDDKKLVEIARKFNFANEKLKKSGETGEHIAIGDDDGNIRMTVKVSNAVNIAPQIDDNIVGEMVVLSVGTPGDNITEILNLLK